jgi:Xaa-Pro aminopeptidase/Xaa-Pro dipeptidase
MTTPFSLSELWVTALQHRRRCLAQRVNFPVLLWSGSASPRNFPANTYPFRASSHFLYFAGLPLSDAVIKLEGGQMTLFMDASDPGATLWQGSSPHPAQIAQMIGAEAVQPLSALSAHVEGAATVAVQDAPTRLQQTRLLGRMVTPATNPQDIDLELTHALVALRLSHDQAALEELQRAAAVTIVAHQAGMRVTRYAQREADIQAAMEAVMTVQNMTCAYTSIVTTHGEILHNNQYHYPVQPGQLLLADVGAETELGWAADVTRTWPTAGRFSQSQRQIYEVVLAAHDTCIGAIAPGVEFQDIHGLAAKVLTEGLVDLGILQGSVADLIEQDAHSLFFPHGVGHLLGLDVHDMEDFGDLAGYAPGRSRSDRFGWCYLRLNRPLQAGMLVTIEPGFYQVPAILNDPERRSRYQHSVNWERLEQFADVRGIRIEDDVLVAETGHTVLTAALPTHPDYIEQLVLGA